MAEYEFPAACRYTKDDEWVRVEGDRVTLGVTDYAQQLLGDVVFIELPKPGDKLEQGEPFGVIESVKAVSDLYAPISGTVVEANTGLEDAPEQVNEGCYKGGWLLIVEPASAAEIEALMDADAYRSWVGERED